MPITEFFLLYLESLLKTKTSITIYFSFAFAFGLFAWIEFLIAFKFKDTNSVTAQVELAEKDVLEVE